MHFKSSAQMLSGHVFSHAATCLMAFICATGVMAVTPVAPSGAIPENGSLLPPSQFLKDKPGFTSWRTLAQVELVKRDKKMVPSFATTVTALDGKQIKVQGFMIPLDIGDKQKRFLLVAAPPHCSFCLPAGPDSMIEVRAKSDVRYGFDAVSLSGKLQVLKDDPAGLFYRLVEASTTE
jgi:uncharacterized protein